MGIDTNIVITRKNLIKDVFEIGKTVESVIRSLTILNRRNSETELKLRDPNNTYQYTKLSPDTGCLYFLFVYNSESRKLQACFDCDCDNSEIVEGSKITFSIGYWGSSEIIMRTLATELAKSYQVYYLQDDSTENWEEITHEH